ncbi:MULTISPECIES: hypothetical protein [Sinorhizobium]|uniref:hypothetical protein n=1 Tax=Sinorhizobium TaxID=28105 RepID=UPI000BE84A92|nr:MULTISPECIES: hypothetical protein [Sinorhizobium]PDT53715.1 hypothetical protein CO664_00560 [Sinorhizobium sp. NG07B]POH30777.1 hypothetical protein ATY30_04380 [Sinorhizobium americanum]
MSSFRSALSLFLAALVLSLFTSAALADGTRLNFAQSFHDLPGVRPVNPLQDGEITVCEQVFIDRYGPFEPSHGRPRFDTIYRCRKGDGPVFQSGRLPPSLERQKRGLNY